MSRHGLDCNNGIYQSTSTEPQSMLKAKKCLIKILDAKYEKANLRAITEEKCLNHLSTTEKEKLLKLSHEFEELFDGTLGDWHCNQVLLQLKEGLQQFHGRLFPIPKKHVDTLKKEIQLGSFKVAIRFRMDFTNLHHTKERQNCSGC